MNGGGIHWFRRTTSAWEPVVLDYSIPLPQGASAMQLSRQPTPVLSSPLFTMPYFSLSMHSRTHTAVATLYPSSAPHTHTHAHARTHTHPCSVSLYCSLNILIHKTSCCEALEPESSLCSQSKYPCVPSNIHSRMS